MSTYVTRSTTKSMPLSADDIAGISLLYPAPGYVGSTGTISGAGDDERQRGEPRERGSGSPVTGAAISNLTNLTGPIESTGFRREPAGNYYLVYVHPLPPAQQGRRVRTLLFFPWTRRKFPLRRIPVRDAVRIGNAGLDAESAVLCQCGRHDDGQFQCAAQCRPSDFRTGAVGLSL